MKIKDRIKELENQHDELRPRLRANDEAAKAESLLLTAPLEKLMSLDKAGFESSEEIAALFSDPDAKKAKDNVKATSKPSKKK